MPNKYQENKTSWSTIVLVDVKMEIFRRLKKIGILIAEGENGAAPPRPRRRPMRGEAGPPRPPRRRQMQDEAPPPITNYDPLPRSFFSAVDLARQEAGYDPLPVFPRGPIPNGEENLMYEQPEIAVPVFDRSRSKSRERSFDRTPRSRSRGTPVKFRRRPISPEILQPRASSPFFFGQHSLPNSPAMQHRFAHPPQFQHMPRQPQFDMMMMDQPVEFLPPFQQPFQQPFHPMMNPMINPNINMPPLFMMRQPQMHPFF